MADVRFETYISTYADAFRSIRVAKNVFWLFVIIGILAHLASFVLIDFVGVLGKPPADTPDASIWYEVFYWGLQATQFLTLALTTLLVLTLLFGVKLSLIGHLGSVSGFISAFFWSLLLLVAVVPWQHALSGRFACGALCNLNDLLVEMARIAPEKDPSWIDKVLYYGRFIAYPAIAFVLAVIVMAKSARGMSQTSVAPPASTTTAPPATPQA